MIALGLEMLSLDIKQKCVIRRKGNRCMLSILAFLITLLGSFNRFTNLIWFTRQGLQEGKGKEILILLMGSAQRFH